MYQYNSVKTNNVYSHFIRHLNLRFFIEHINTEIESKLVDKLPEEFKILEDPRKVRKPQNNLIPNNFLFF